MNAEYNMYKYRYFDFHLASNYSLLLKIDSLTKVLLLSTLSLVFEDLETPKPATVSTYINICLLK